MGNALIVRPEESVGWVAPRTFPEVKEMGEWLIKQGILPESVKTAGRRPTRRWLGSLRASQGDRARDGARRAGVSAGGPVHRQVFGDLRETNGKAIAAMVSDVR